MAILAIARFLVKQDVIAPKSNMQQSVIFAPWVNATQVLSQANLTTPQNMTNNNQSNSTNSTMNLNQTQFSDLQNNILAYSYLYGSFGNFTQTNLQTGNPLTISYPTHCQATNNFNSSPVIGIAAPDAYFNLLSQDLTSLFAVWQQAQSVAAQNKTLQKLLSAVGLNIGQNINFTIQRFNTSDDIQNYLSSSKYEQSMANPGMCFGFSIDETGTDNMDIRLFFSGQFQDPSTQSIPSQLNPMYDDFSTKADFNSFNLYKTQGYSLMQNWIANSVLRVKSNNTQSTIAFAHVPFYTDTYINDDFGQIMAGMLPFFLLLIYILPMYRLISNIVSEKESKARESMRMMGLVDFSYWLSWWVYYVIIVTIISALCIIVLSFNVIKYSNMGLIFLYFWLYGLSLFGLAIFLQSFFSNARIAAITGTLVYFGTSFINAAVNDQSVQNSNKVGASLLSTVAISLASNNLARFETSGVGLVSSNINTLYLNYSMGNCYGMMVASLIMFSFVGLYLDNVLPSAYGLRKHWYYFLTRSYWFGDKIKNQYQRKNSKNAIDAEQDQNNEDEVFFEAKYMKKENFEPAPRELMRQEQEQKILKITGLEKTFDNGFQAVRGLNLKMYTNQIFCLLGHNGAGKTTTISMLTGLINSTQGLAEVFGVDLFEDMDTVRQFLGVCPQHDILFDLLTPEEHLDIFCDFKGVNSKDKDEEIKKMLIDVDVYHHRNTIAENLSGGSRRKLSVAIALIGGSKLVLLDEPTSGMDLSARRKLWNMLKNYKSNRIIILTTHYMDEADILGDRIGIMTEGRLICLGSSLFLKNRFGVGYNLTMVKKDKKPNTLIGKYLQSNLGPEVKLLSEVSSEITYQIPNALSNKFKDFFTQFDTSLDSLGIRSYGISVTTLEEVFLKVGHGEDTNDAKMIKNEILEVSKNTKLSEEEEFSISDPQNHLSVISTFFKHLEALFLKRYFIYRRNTKGLITEILIPVLIVLIGFAFTEVQFFQNQPNKIMQTTLFPLPQRILANQQLVVNTPTSIQPQQIFGALPNISSSFQITYQNYPNIQNSSNFNQTALGSQFDLDVFANRLNGSYSPYRFGSYYMYQADNATKQFKAAVFLNLTSQDVAAAYPSYLYQAVLQQALGKPNLNFTITTIPYPVTQKLRNRARAANGVFIAFVVSIGFALVPAVVVSFIINEREKNLKHMQLISGMSLTAYWISNLVFDICKGILPSAIVIGLTYAFSLNYNTSWVLFLLYPVGVIPFTYVSSFLFRTENVAQTITIFLHFVFAGIGAIIVFILRIIPSTYSVGDALNWAFKIVPSYCLTSTILLDSSFTGLVMRRPELAKSSMYDISIVGGNILVIMLHFIFWNFVLLLIELGAFNWTYKLIDFLPKNKIPPKSMGQLHLDDDVLEEEERVAKASDLKVKVSAFRKVYPSLFREPVMAVERTSFGLEYGECFALLGINGAGKSTTFKALTCEIQATQGRVQIEGFNVWNQFDKARKLIGYCPQHDAIFDLVTVEEHLEYYARIKGIPDRIRQNLIEKQIKDMNLQEHRKKPAGTLSGGNKRKLSVAMSIIGNPPIILLDEPSAGMDPEARRFMWSIVARISQQRKKSAVILTTHSMEEAEALSTKMGIMVKGGVFRCFGSSQHIKNKFGTGYEIEVKVRKHTPEDYKTLKEQFNLNKIEGDLAPLATLIDILKQKQVEQFLIDEIRTDGLGNDLVKEAAEQRGGMVSVENFLTWVYIEQAGMGIINGLCSEFASVEILEHYSDYYKLRVPRGEKSIGFVFGLIEGQKENFKISEYSVSQTTLEQIFQAFANMKIDDDTKRKLLFKKLLGSSRAELYSERASADISLKAQVTAKGKTIGQPDAKAYDP